MRYAASLAQPRPWFAIGGIDAGNLDEVLDAGARRVVVVRAITEADDPAAATAELAKRIRARAAWPTDASRKSQIIRRTPEDCPKGGQTISQFGQLPLVWLGERRALVNLQYGPWHSLYQDGSRTHRA